VSEGAVKKEEKPRKFQAIKGTRDLLPPETALWNRVEQTAHEVFATFGFGEIRLPIFEQTDLFARSIGLETDVVSKEMYSFEDRDETSVSLRPEATASVCRAYIENGMQQLPQPVKLYTMGPMFRRERPQKGRYRQFYQIDAEVLGGSDAPGIDAELIEMVMTFFERLGLEGVRLQINSIGDKNCRPKYVELLRDELRKVNDKLGSDSQRRIETNPLRVLDSKVESEQEIIEKLPRIAQHLCDACRENYDEVKRQLALRGIVYTQNFRLVRGLDYYMRTTFEITAKGLGSQNAVCGGGRYDGLVEMLGGPPTKGIGFAIGEDRLILSLQEAGKTAAPQGRDVYVAWMGEKAYATALRTAKNLRAAGLSVELPPVEQKFGKALGQADKLGARYALILGDNEVASGEWTLKTLASGEQAKFKEADLLDFLRKSKAMSS
jgi:histidyl-tRNA synthetase